MSPRHALSLEDRRAVASILAAALLADLRQRPQVPGQGGAEPTGDSADDTARSDRRAS